MWWEEIKGQVRTAAGEKAAQFEAQDTCGADPYLSIFGYRGKSWVSRKVDH